MPQKAQVLDVASVTSGRCLIHTTLNTCDVECIVYCHKGQEENCPQSGHLIKRDIIIAPSSISHMDSEPPRALRVHRGSGHARDVLKGAL